MEDVQVERTAHATGSNEIKTQTPSDCSPFQQSVVSIKAIDIEKVATVDKENMELDTTANERPMRDSSIQIENTANIQNNRVSVIGEVSGKQKESINQAKTTSIDFIDLTR